MNGLHMTEHFTQPPRPDASWAGPLVSNRAGAPRRSPGAPVGRVVPHADVDMLLLYDTPRPHSDIEAFQFLLRAMCTSQHRVDRAGLRDGHISMDVNGVALAFGADRLPDRRNGVFYRPEDARKPHGAARLGFFLYRHQACLRLRVAQGASQAVLSDIVGHVVRCMPPKAVVLYDSRIVLTPAELLARPPAIWAALVPGAIVPRPVARYARPSDAGGGARRSAFDPSRTRSRAMSLEVLIASDAALREQARLRAALGLRAGRGQARRSGQRVAVAVALAVVTMMWV